MDDQQKLKVILTHSNDGSFIVSLRLNSNGNKDENDFIVKIYTPSYPSMDTMKYLFPEAARFSKRLANFLNVEWDEM